MVHPWRWDKAAGYQVSDAAVGCLRECLSTPELTSPSLHSGRAATMKPNEPQSRAAAACPASARNQSAGERVRVRQGRRERKMRAIEWRVQKRAIIHVDHSNSQLLLSSSTLTLFIFVLLFSDTRTKTKAQRCALVKFCPTAAATAAEQYIPLCDSQTKPCG